MFILSFPVSLWNKQTNKYFKYYKNEDGVLPHLYLLISVHAVNIFYPCLLDYQIALSMTWLNGSKNIFT